MQTRSKRNLLENKNFCNSLRQIISKREVDELSKKPFNPPMMRNQTSSPSKNRKIQEAGQQRETRGTRRQDSGRFSAYSSQHHILSKASSSPKNQTKATLFEQMVGSNKDISNQLGINFQKQSSVHSLFGRGPTTSLLQVPNDNAHMLTRQQIRAGTLGGLRGADPQRTVSLQLWPQETFGTPMSRRFNIAAMDESSQSPSFVNVTPKGPTRFNQTMFTRPDMLRNVSHEQRAAMGFPFNQGDNTRVTRKNSFKLRQTPQNNLFGQPMPTYNLHNDSSFSEASAILTPANQFPLVTNKTGINNSRGVLSGTNQGSIFNSAVPQNKGNLNFSSAVAMGGATQGPARFTRQSSKNRLLGQTRSDQNSLK